MPGPHKKISMDSRVRLPSESLLLGVLQITKACSLSSQTTQANASVTLTFNGEEVQIYGYVGPNASPYLVQVDNSTVGSFNGTKWNQFSGVVLYETSNLGPGQHTLTLMNTPAGTAQSLSIAYAVVTDNTTDISSDTSR